MYFVVLLAFVGQELGPYWPYPGPLWAMVTPYWGHVEPLWAILGAVLSCKVFAKNTVNTSEKSVKNALFGLVADGLCFLFGVCLFLFLWGMLHLVYACLISGLCWTILGYVSAMLGSC